MENGFVIFSILFLSVLFIASISGVLTAVLNEKTLLAYFVISDEDIVDYLQSGNADVLKQVLRSQGLLFCKVSSFL